MSEESQTELDPTIQAFIAAAQELNDTIRRGHELLKDLRSELKRAEKLHKTLPGSAYDQIGKAVAAGLKEFEVELEKAINIGTQGVYRRFDILADIMLGEDPETKAKGLPSIAGLLLERRDQLPAAYSRNIGARLRQANKKTLEES